MSYLFLFILLLPVKLIGKLFYKKTDRNLVIQTAKIGDFINITPLLAHLKKSDILISKTALPLARNDETIDTIFLVEKHKKNLWRKFCLVIDLMNRYDNIYLLHPNSANLFFAALCNAGNKQFLSTYSRRWYHKIFYLTAKGIVEHSKSQLTVDNYLKLADRKLTWRDYAKHATLPLRVPVSWPESLDTENVIKIGLSISAGNKAKTIPPVTWKRLFDSLQDLPCVYYIFGSKNEQINLDELYKATGQQDNIVSLIGSLSLEDLPFAIKKMDFYIASDSGNVYIADAMGVPIVLIYGPCCIKEQRPLGEVLLIGDTQNINSFVFETRYYFDKTKEELFSLNCEDLQSIRSFIDNNLSKKSTQTTHSRLSFSVNE